MKKIKEKPTLSERIKEKAVSTPRELLRKGLDDGSERLRTQLRDTAQHGQADEYGGDTIEDTAARGLRRAEKELTRQRKKKPQEQPPEGGAPAADATGQKPSAIKEKDTTSAGSQPQTAAERGRQQARQNAAQKAAKVKTKDTYIGAQTETQVTVAAEPQRQGQRVFMEERGRKAARWQAEQERAAESRRHKPYIQTGTVAPCRTECVRSRYRTSKNGLKPACPNQRGKSTCRWGVTSSLFRRVLRR